MDGSTNNDASDVRHRVYGDARKPVVVYLPGLHGDWTLVGGLRARLEEYACFVEFAYPRSPDRTLNDYAREIAGRLRSLGFERYHLVAESFGSQVAWAMIGEPDAARRIQSLVLAGGFVRHPFARQTPIAAKSAARFPAWLFRLLMRLWFPVARFLYEKRPALAEDFRAFARARQVSGDSEAIALRLRMIAENDFSETAAKTVLPVFCLSGFWDPVVPWSPVRRWLARHCPGFRKSRVLAQADHAVLVAQPTASAAKILGWIAEVERLQETPALHNSRLRQSCRA